LAQFFKEAAVPDSEDQVLPQVPKTELRGKDAFPVGYRLLSAGVFWSKAAPNQAYHDRSFIAPVLRQVITKAKFKRGLISHYEKR
jgi:hypothetical protein